MKAALVAIGLAAIALTGCATTPLVPEANQTIVLQTDTSLDLLYNTAARIYLSQVPTMDPALKAKVKPMLQKARSLVAACDNGQLLGAATSMVDQIGEATALIGNVKSLLGVG